jgi:glycosyltransferase involved in cell wall biosynthesis
VTQYVIITPVRDEEQHVEATIESVSLQTVRPAEWVIVDDGSTDRTGTLLDQYAGQLPWIHVIHKPNRGFRKSGEGVVDAFNAGYNALRCDDWDFIVKLDGDLSFSPDYFQKCFERFRARPRLGIGGGEIYHVMERELKLEANPRFHIRGATKIYRKRCWEDIGGLWPGAGWDTIDEVKANMLGWETMTFEDLHLVHHRITGLAEGLVRDKVKHGLACYISGYHPLFVAASSLYRLVRKPYVIGALAMVFGFLKGYLTHTPQVNDERLIRYLRAQQLRRLCGLKSIWK